MINPYAHKDNSKLPQEGKVKEFIDWARERELERRKSLPPEEVKKLEEADRNMQDKMNS